MIAKDIDNNNKCNTDPGNSVDIKKEGEVDKVACLNVQNRFEFVTTAQMFLKKVNMDFDSGAFWIPL